MSRRILIFVSHARRNLSDNKIFARNFPTTTSKYHKSVSKSCNSPTTIPVAFFFTHIHYPGENQTHIMTAVTRDKEFYMTLITFKASLYCFVSTSPFPVSHFLEQVEDVLFRVSADDFKGHSEVFRDMFSLPHTRKGEVMPEGSSDWNPIVLEGVKADDFRALLRHLYTKCVVRYLRF